MKINRKIMSHKVSVALSHLTFVICSLSFGVALTSCDDNDKESAYEASFDATLSTPVVTDVRATSAYVTADYSGKATGMVKKGFCYSENAEPTILDRVTDGSMETRLQGLTASTTYYLRAYAYCAGKTVYSEIVSFTTPEITDADLLEQYVCPSYADDYRSISSWDLRDKWNLANVHDPSVMLAEDGYYYMYCTDAGFGNPQAGHGHFHCRRSKNMVDWEYLGATMADVPEWIPGKLNEIRAAMGLAASTTDFSKCGFWAPCARKVNDGLYRMYYAITIDGTIDGDGTWGERAFIGLMETTNPADVTSWEDKGFVITNYSDKELNFRVPADSYTKCYFKFNAIDPTYIITPEGQHWLIYGSWHCGFAAVQLNPETGKTIVSPLPNPWGSANEAAYGKRVASRRSSYNLTSDGWHRWQASEAPEVVYRDGWYYLFMAYDALDVPYNTRVVRSRNINGPYSGVNGTNVTEGGDAYPILTHPYKFGFDNGWVGIAHCAVWNDGNDNWYYASQARFPETAGGNAPNAVMLGHVRSIRWTKAGWPVVMPERYGAVPQVEITDADIVGTWDHIDLSYSASVQKGSQVMTFGADHKIAGGPWNGSTWSFDPETNTLTANGVELLLQREVDWEAAPRRVTIVYAGINGTKTYWGKKK